MVIYGKERSLFLALQPICNACRPVCNAQGVQFRQHASCDVHHSAGRTGRNYLDKSTWIPVCRSCHNWIHRNPEKARELGLLK